MPAQARRIQSPHLCRPRGATRGRIWSSRRRETIPANPRTNSTDFPMSNLSPGRSPMKISLPNLAPPPPCRRPNTPLPSTKFLSRTAMPMITFRPVQRKLNPRRCPPSTGPSMTIVDNLHRRPAKNQQTVTRMAVTPPMRVRRFLPKPSASRAIMEGDDAHGRAIRDRNGESLRLPAQNWFAGNSPLLRLGRSS